MGLVNFVYFFKRITESIVVISFVSSSVTYVNNSLVKQDGHAKEEDYLSTTIKFTTLTFSGNDAISKSSVKTEAHAGQGTLAKFTREKW